MSISNNIVACIIALVALSACSSSSQQESTSESDTSQELKETNDKVSLKKLWETDTSSLLTPESVLHDKTNDILYVSCINGVPPNAKDNDGYIAKINPEDGSIIDPKWVDGLHAPKGMGLYEGTLYVTNIDELVAIDVATGEVSNRYAVAEAKFLNDITVDDDGNVYFSDSNTNKIHRLSQTGELDTWIDDANMGGPNGLFHDGEKMMMATFGSGRFHAIDYTEEKVEPVVDSIPGGDGVVKVGVDYLVSNWNGEVYYVTSTWEKEKILDTKDMGANAADIEFIADDQKLLVPTFFGNQVVAYTLVK
ncbi:SMP-30/gluconolactonase/LRE family protein [Marinoscillum furvescens]|nr:SMP-30/gluconolactonase/LRE family protein [Marinoscillum furvescens]